VAADDPGTLANAALALASFGEDIGAMMALVDRALALNPSYARGWHISASSGCGLGNRISRSSRFRSHRRTGFPAPNKEPYNKPKTTT
jgi:hypothetical protein